MRAYRFALLIAMMRIVLFAENGNCPDGSPGSTVVFVNGIETTKQAARDMAGFLKSTVSPLLSPAVQSCTNFTYKWNTHGTFIGDLYESARQDIGDDTSVFYRWLSNLDGAPVWFKVLFETKAEAIDSAEYVDIQDLADMVQFYQQEINDKDNTLVVVSHSQGNFFANESYRNLGDEGIVLPDTSKFNIVAVATPAGTVEGYPSGPPLYTTLCEDFIWKIPGALDYNLINSVGLCAESKLAPAIDPFGIWKHDFVNSYLADGTNSKPVIVGQITEFLKRGFLVGTNPLQSQGGPTIGSYQFLAQQFTLTRPVQRSLIRLLMAGADTDPFTLWVTNRLGPGATADNVLFRVSLNFPDTGTGPPRTVSVSVNVPLTAGTYYLVASTTEFTPELDGWWTATTGGSGTEGTVGPAFIAPSGAPSSAPNALFPPASKFVPLVQTAPSFAEPFAFDIDEN